MRMLLAAAVGLAATVGLAAAWGQTPPPAAGRGPTPPRQNMVGPADRPGVDEAAAKRARPLWAAECTSCHGTDARGTDKGSNLIRSEMALRDRNGSTMGPFLKKGHPAGQSSRLTDDQIYELAQYVREQVNNSLRGSPLFVVRNVLTGDPKAGAAFFSGPGQCGTCHSTTGDLAGVGAKYEPVDLQQRMLFPRPAGRGGAAGAWKGATSVTVKPRAGPAVSGLLVELNDFTITLRDSDGFSRTFTRTPSLAISKHDPLAAHRTMLDEITDRNIHDLVAYLETLK
jgi:mono/diheme cytochrome c family protein